VRVFDDELNPVQIQLGKQSRRNVGREGDVLNGAPVDLHVRPCRGDVAIEAGARQRVGERRDRAARAQENGVSRRPGRSHRRHVSVGHAPVQRVGSVNVKEDGPTLGHVFSDLGL